MSTLSLVLSGGGARAAYQTGALLGVGEICNDLKIHQPFQIYTGVSAGAINASYITSHSGSFHEASQNLQGLWSHLRSEDVFISNPISLTHEGLRWIADLSLGGIKKSTPGKSLLNTAPLRELILKNCNFENIQNKIQSGVIQALGVTALDYFNASSITFLESHEKVPTWERSRRRSQRTKITADHLMASAAIPLLFPPINLGQGFFGDGSIRNLSPCAPAIYMGAERILAIGVRSRRDPCTLQKREGLTEAPTVARILSVMLNAIMMDGLELDIERITRINTEMAQITERERKKLSVRPIDALWISPSRDLSEIATRRSGDLPRMIRYLLRGLGSLEEAGEITSFLLFEESFCQELIEIGFEDAMKQKEKIRRFLS